MRLQEPFQRSRTPQFVPVATAVATATEGRPRSATPADVGSMIDPQDGHRAAVVVDLVDDTVRSPSSRPQAGELPLEGMSNPPRDVNERTDQELDDGCCRAVGESSE